MSPERKLSTASWDINSTNSYFSDDFADNEEEYDHDSLLSDDNIDPNSFRKTSGGDHLGMLSEISFNNILTNGAPQSYESNYVYSYSKRGSKLIATVL